MSMMVIDPYRFSYGPVMTPLVCDYYYPCTPIIALGEGNDGSTTIANYGYDRWGYGLASLGSAQVDTAQAKFGGSSILMLGTGTTSNGSCVHTSDNSISTNPAYMLYLDFTFDMWVRPQTLPSGYAYLLDGRAGAEGAHPSLRINPSGYLEYYVSSAIRITSSVAITTNTWSFVELSRTGGTTRLFLNGVLVGSWADTTSYVSTRYVFGCSSLSNIATTRHYGLDGWMEEMRITRGYARHTADYDVPTESAYAMACAVGLNAFIDSLAPKIWFKYETLTSSSGWSANSVHPNFGTETSVTGLVYGGIAGGTDGLCAESVHGIACTGTFPGYSGSTAPFVSQYDPGSTTTYYANTITICMNIHTQDDWTSADVPLWHEGAVAQANNQGMYFTYRVATKVLDVNYYASGAWRTENIADLTAMGGLVNNTKYHLAWVFNHSAKTLKAYVNGDLKGTLTMAYTVPDTAYKASIGRTAATNTTNSGNGANMFLDNFLLFNSEISAADILTMAQLSLPTDTFYGPEGYEAAPTTQLLLHMDGTNGSTTITDSSWLDLTCTAVGNAQISTAQSKWGGASALFDGTGDYITVPHHILMNTGPRNFTIHFWVRTTTVAAGQAIFATKRADNTVFAPFIIRRDGNVLNLLVSESGAAWQINTSGGTLVADTWHHIALVRNGNSVKLYLDGNSAASGTLTSVSATLMTNSAAMVIGGDTNANYHNGYIDEVVWEGSARWTANFTPPSGPTP